MKKFRNIQVFLVGDSTAEINGDEFKYKRLPEVLFIAVKHDADNTIMEYEIPWRQVRMVRRWMEE